MGKSFASDNNSGAHPAVFEAVARANQGHVVAYGADCHTESAIKVLKSLLGDEAEVFFVFLGTAANVLGLKSVVRSHQAVVLADTAHANVDECGAPEQIIGCKLLPVCSVNGKIRVGDIRPLLHSRGFEHHSQPGAVSITQCTELGAVYTLEEIREIADFAHENGLYLHMDGARLANAAAWLGLEGLREITVEAGVDVLSLGGTKNGMMFGEAVVFFRPELARDFKYVRKQGMQLASKMRFISAQFEALYGGGLWLENARRANRAARDLAEKAGGITGVEITRPVESNAVFARLPARVVSLLQEEYFFYVWDQESGEVRWMTSFDTEPGDVDDFVRTLSELMDRV